MSLVQVQLFLAIAIREPADARSHLHRRFSARSLRAGLGVATAVWLCRAVAPLREHGVGHAGGHLVTSVFPPWHPSPPGAWLGSPFLFPMALVPRWRYMTDDAKALARRSAVSAAVVLVALLLFRGLLPWVALGLAAWWIWKAVNR